MNTRNQRLKTTAQRFEEKIIKTPGCWNWVGAKHGNGYGAFWNHGKNHDAHRFSYENHAGQIPQGLIILHSCGNRACVNPDHLRPGTHKDNADDRSAHGRTSIGSKNKMAVLSESDIPKIISRYAMGDISQESLGKIFGVDQTIISDVILRKTWKHAAP